MAHLATKSKALSLLLTGALTLTLAACGTGGANGSSSGKSGDTGSAATEQPSHSGKQITLKVIHWQNEPVNKFMEQFNKKFEQENPGVKVEYTTVPSDSTYDQLMQTRVNANDTDILAFKSGFVGAPQDWSKGAAEPLWQQWIKAGLIADLSGQDFVKNYNPADVTNAMSYDGKVYGINMGKVAFTGLFYNKDIFAKYNLQIPKTWDELVAVMKTLKDNGVSPIGFAGKDVWPINLAVQGLQAAVYDDQLAYIKGLWTGETKYTDPKAIEVLEKAQVLMDNAVPGFMGIDYGTLPSLFASGKVAMVADGTWDAPAIASANPSLKFGYFPIPGSSAPSKNAALAGKYDMTWSVLEKSKNKEMALKYLSELSTPENYAAFANAAGFLPTQPNVKMDSPLITEIEPYLSGFKLAWDQLFINRQNVGQYANSSVHAEFLKPAGPIATPQELAEKSQKDWDAAAPK